MLTEEDCLFRLVISEEFLARSRYFYAGLFIGLSPIQGGPYPDFLVAVLTNSPPGEELKQFRKGLSRPGIEQLMDAKSTIKYLFTPSSSATLNVNKILQIFRFGLSEEGTNRRRDEEVACREFTRYLRDVYAGRRPGVTLEHILKFATGSSTIPLLGFALQPKIDFADIMFPTASTCVNHMTVPLRISSDNMDIGFMNDFFGLE
ncbi:G2/M phase-specific E3 ubiquitin-protein ligase-like [Argopecten irradians]|uniref:G2/M phase-specific E3 ubiquitin-protein ligase-like n=1 Tax=Argopecten irradians TaxID=31199 RepID=UPI00371A5E84